MNRPAQDRLREEVQRVLTSNSVNQTHLSYDTLAEMPFLDACIPETLRLYPSVTRLERQCAEDCVLSNGLQVKKGIIVAVPAWYIQRSPENFVDPLKFVSLCEQNLVDCSGPQGDNGCEGGLMDDAFAYVKQNHGIDTEASYPYTAEDSNCAFKHNAIGATLKSWTDVESGSESALTNAIATVGPISVAIDASNPSFQAYSSGVYFEDQCSSSQLDHGVLAVGYGKKDGSEYYLVKNSWGADWGMDGYIMMSRNKDNNCGIATMSSYPVE